MTTPLVDKILAVHNALNDNNISYAFSGGIALGFHVIEPRTTNDLDLALAVSPNKASVVFAALPPLVRYSGVQQKIAEVTGEVKLRWLKETSIDLFFITNDYHIIVQNRKEEYSFYGTKIPIVTATDLTILKVLFNRPKDWGDIDALLRAGTVDQKEALKWIANLTNGIDDIKYQKLLNAIKESEIA